MRTPVVVCTGRGRGGWLADCLGSIREPDVTVAYSQTDGELGAIRMIYDGTRWPRWVMLQDSCVVLDQALFRLVDEVGGPALLAPQPCMYLAIYERKALDEIGIPRVPAGADRSSAIRHELDFMGAYVEASQRLGLDCPVLFPDFDDAHAVRREERHGRLNLVLQNEYLTKYKGTWR